MNLPDENQHYISRILLKRFREPGLPLQSYQLLSRTWEAKSLERLCSAQGYNQLKIAGEGTNNWLETSMSRIESMLPKTIAFLEKAARQTVTEMPLQIRQNLWHYVTFLKQTSLFAKASAAVNFLTQLNMELANARYDLWGRLRTPPRVIENFRQGYLHGFRAMVETDNVVQLLYRFQFEHLLDVNYWQIASSDWTVSVSPIDLPMPDIGVIQYNVEDLRAVHYLLPLGPRLVLDGFFYYDLGRNSQKTTIKGNELTQEEAEYRHDCICLASVREIICSRIDANVPASLLRGKERGLRFARIKDPDLVAKAGARNSSRNYRLKLVPAPEYRQFVHSLITPW